MIPEFPGQRVFTLKFVDVIGEQPCHSLRRPPRPSRPDLLQLIAQGSIKGGGQFSEERVQKVGNWLIAPDSSPLMRTAVQN